MKKLVIFVLVVVLLVPSVVYGAAFFGGERYSLSSDEAVTQDLYVGGGSVTISGDVRGDLVIGGGNVLVTGNVSNDVIVAGGTVHLLGNVDDDVRAAGGQIVIGKNVKGDVVVGAGSVEILSSAVVSGDVVVAGGELTVAGTVHGRLRPKVGTLYIEGNIKGDVDAWVTEKIVVASGTVVEGKLTYHSPKEAIIDGGAVIRGGVDFKKTAFGGENTRKGLFFGILTGFALWKLLALLLTSVLAVWLLKNRTREIVHSAIQHFWKETGRGFLFLVVVPIAVLILFLTFIGSFVGLLGLVHYVLVIFLAKVFSGILFGSWLWKVMKKSQEVHVGYPQALVGTLVLFLISFIPILGWIVCAIFFLTVMGVLYRLVYERLRS